MRISYFGDDFTGSTDVMEYLSRFGLRTALLTALPRQEDLRRLESFDAVGIAGNTRSLPTDRMEGVLRPAFELLRSLGAPIVHYKICSTFDSSPTVGSIGRVIEIGRDVFESRAVPVVVGAPDLGRYCVFGNLFARSGLDSEPFRLDRHPTMQQHPVTPMNESDLRVHLSRQTDLRVDLLDILTIGDSPESATARYEEIARGGAGVILLDTLYHDQLATIGEVLSSATAEGTLFSVGSSGIEMALGAAWARRGEAEEVRFADPGRVEPILVLSGSCSPVTKRQIELAIGDGFAGIPLTIRGDTDAVAREVVRALDSGRSVVVHTALGSDDRRIVETREILEAEAESDSALKSLCVERVGRALGQVGRRVLSTRKLERVVVTGGDTSWHVANDLGIESLEMVAPMAPGSPLCRARGSESPADGVQFVFKGGQVGKDDLLPRVTMGTP